MCFIPFYSDGTQIDNSNINAIATAEAAIRMTSEIINSTLNQSAVRQRSRR